MNTVRGCAGAARYGFGQTGSCRVQSTTSFTIRACLYRRMIVDYGRRVRGACEVEWYER